MRPYKRNIFASKYLLLFIAIILFSVTFIFNKLYTNRSSVSREARLCSNYIVKHQQDFNEFLTDSSLIRKLVDKKESISEFRSVSQKSYSIFLYSATDLGNVFMKFWSKQIAETLPQTFGFADGEYFQKLRNGQYIIVKKTLNLKTAEGKIIAVALIPIRSDYFIETEYLPKEFFYSKDAEKRVEISSVPTEFPVKGISDTPLFYFDKKITGAVPFNDKLTIVLRVCALFFLLFFVQLLAESIARNKGAWPAIGILALIIVVLRVVTYQYPSLLNLRQFELFDPSIYGSNIVQRSLGDLLINAVLFCWIALFSWSKLKEIEKPADSFNNTGKWIAGALALCMLILSTFVLSSVIRSMVADSKISFDVTDFFSLNRYTVFGFAVLACLSLSYYYFTQLLFRLIFPLFHGKNIYIYFIIGAAGLIYLTVKAGDNSALFYVPVLLWLLLYTWLVNRQGLIFNRIRINITGVLFWIFVFSVSIAAIMLIENKKAEWERRKNYADKLAVQADPSSERLLSIGLRYLDEDFLRDNLERFKDPDLSHKIKDSILTENYSGYLNKYDTRFYVYDAANRPVNNYDPATYEDLNTLLEVQAKPAKGTSGLYYYEESFDKFIYITKKTILDTAGQQIGSLFILSNPKRFSSDALFPELFKQYRQNDPESSPIYSYAIYSNLSLLSPSNKYPFPTSIEAADVPTNEFEKRINGDYVELWYRASKSKVVVLSRKKDTIIETITLFSYIFCSFLFLVLLLQLISIFLKSVYDRRYLRRLFQFNIRSQVHSTIIFISIFSFLIIGVSTISFFINRYDRSNTDKLSRTMNIMLNEMQKELADHSVFDDEIKIYDTITNFNLQKLVEDISDIHGIDVNVYDLQGNLYLSSEANLYTKGVVSKKIEPNAFYELSRYRLIQHTQKEKIGNLSYLSIYAPVRDTEGKVYAYVNIPYFTSLPELNMEISNFLVTIINLNAFIFLIAGLIALFITNRITQSFSLISDKMKEVNLGKMNEMIEWNREDEIGELVTEYNKMVGKLEESATALAKSEREGAWREMARQVAHEIKNPLTPMKLSIQYLQKAIDNNQPNVKELSSNVANTLVEQIDHLSKIAADFSQFANIGTTNMTRFDLHDVLSSLKELYRTDETVQFDWHPVNDEVFVKADKTQMNRLFTNLFTNAVQACEGNGICKIEVNEKIANDMVTISVKDNGEGIPEEMRSRIFVPNFTTKSSGTGLGLAMCKGIVEQAHGRIWFETEIGKGSTFVVELPLAD